MQKSSVKILSVSAALLLSACSAETYKEAEVTCPSILIAKDTAEITKIVDNETLWTAGISNYKGYCSFNKTKDELELNLSIDFTAELIKPVFERGFTLKYYVAAPALYPAAVGKQNFYLDVVFPEDKDKINIRKKSIDLSFPLLNENGEEVDIKDIYVGIQLDKEQLDFNRSKQFK
jgi:hypothetical protein